MLTKVAIHFPAVVFQYLFILLWSWTCVCLVPQLNSIWLKIWQSHGTELHATRQWWWLVQRSSVSCLFEIPRSRFPHWPWLLGYNCQLFHRPLDCSSCHHHRLQNPVPPRAWSYQAQGGPRAPLPELHHSYQPAPRDRVRGQHHRHQRQGGERALGRPANNRQALRDE